MNRLEENTNFMLQECWKKTFKRKYSFDSFPGIFNKRRPDGIQFIKNGMIIIENKKDISLYDKGFNQLKEYVMIAHDSFKNFNLYGVLGFGTEELTKISYKFTFLDNSNENSKNDIKNKSKNESILKIEQIDFSSFNELAFMEPEEWISKYYSHKNSYVIELNDSIKNEIETILKDKYNINLYNYIDYLNKDSNEDSNLKDDSENDKNNEFMNFFNTYYQKSTNKFTFIKTIFKLATTINLKGNNKFKQGFLCSIIPSSKISISISDNKILNELLEIFKDNLYILNGLSIETSEKYDLERFDMKDLDKIIIKDYTFRTV